MLGCSKSIILCTTTIQAVQILSLLYLFKYVQIMISHYIAMFVALLWFCTRLLCTSLSTHQSCVKDTLAISLNMHFFLDIKCIRNYICFPLLFK